MNHIKPAMLEAAVHAQEGTFNSHDVIRFLYTNYQHEYLSELIANGTAKYPFTETHRQIGKALARLKNLIDKLGKVPSIKTMRGKRTLVEKWRKLPASTRAAQQGPSQVSNVA